jgi:hypothetical protein
MPGTTPVYGFPYPEPTDLVADYPALGQQLAEDIEAVLPDVGGLAQVAPTSIANSGGSASTTANTTTFSGVSSISLNGVFSATYTHYRMIIVYTASTGNGVNLRLRAAGTDIVGNLYYNQRVSGESTTVAATRTVNPDTFWGGYLVGTTVRNNAVIELTEPFATERTGMLTQHMYSTTGLYLHGGYYNATTSADGCTFYTTTGTITGIVSVFGYKK